MSKSRGCRANQSDKTGKQLHEAQERLFKILDSIDAFIYVADMKTYEVLFANKHIRDLWGDVLGKKCWQEIQAGQNGPCNFCNNDLLLDSNGNPAGVKQRIFQNTRNKRWYDCRDRAIGWSDNRIVRLEIALDITELKKTEEELARLQVLHALEEERMRLARDLHDELGMTLTAVKLDLQIVKNNLAKKETGLHDQLSASIALINSSLDKVREKSASLRPPALDDLGLVAAVNNLTQVLRHCSNINVEFLAADEHKKFSQDVEITLYRCIQEAFSNVVRHSCAQNVKVELFWDMKEVRLTVKDDGTGFDVHNQKVSGNTLGLQGMEERVSLLSGAFTVQSSPIYGTEIDVRIPL